MSQQPRRLRTNATLRALVSETRISKDALVYPLFVRWGKGVIEDLPSLLGQKIGTADKICQVFESAYNRGIRNVLLFGVPQHKDEQGSSAWESTGPVQTAIPLLKSAYPDLNVITDVCLCEYTNHGHCGIVNDGDVDNDKTTPLLAKVALSHVWAGADVVAPSDMMDGRVGVIRTALDKQGFNSTAIMSYAAKYSSAFYGPFRDAAGSAPAFGNRKSYQMDMHNGKEALRECALDIAEGADIVIVKPALPCLDIIWRVAQESTVPVAAYNVSGEYAMVKAAAANGLINEKTVICEIATSVFRAGANILISYHAPEIAEYIDEGLI